MVGLMDCNNFFVSCERLFRPDLKGMPVAVLSSNDGCIVARSQEVKDIGIPMGAPYFQVEKQCEEHTVTLFSSNFPLYRDISNRVMHALKEEFETISTYSIDEAFFTIDTNMTEGDILKIRTRIMQKTGIPVSFGIAPTKTIAKIANNEAKKGNGVVWLTLGDAQSRYRTISCGSVWGIGRQMTKRLDALGIRTVENLIQKDSRFIRQEFGVHGERLLLELTGTDALDSSSELSPHASIMSTQSFHKNIHEKPLLESAIGHHIAHIGEKLRKRGLMATMLSIVCAPSRHSAYALRVGRKHKELAVPTNDTAELLKQAHELFLSIYEKDVPYKKAGAIVSGLIPDSYVAPSLFASLSRESSPEQVYGIVDSLNERFGKGTVRPAIISNARAWASSARLRSKEYTTHWSEIATVKAV